MLDIDTDSSPSQLKKRLCIDPLKVEDYLLQTLSSVLTSTVRDTENRMARIDFKVAVELSKLAHIIAYSHDIDDAALNKLHLKCLEEVKRINGTVDFESANKYQKRET